MRAALISAFLILSPVAYADDAAMPSLLSEAIAFDGNASWSRSDWSFTITIGTADGDIVGRFEGAQGENGEWTLMSPAHELLTEEQLAEWTNTISPGEEDESSGLLFSGDEAEMICGDVVELSSTPTHILYGFRPNMGDDEDEADFDGHVTGEISIRRADAAVEMLRIYATESFKPHPVARLTEFEMRFDYLSDADAPGPVLHAVSANVVGSAMFQSFEERQRLSFSEIEYRGQSIGD